MKNPYRFHRGALQLLGRCIADLSIAIIKAHPGITGIEYENAVHEAIQAHPSASLIYHYMYPRGGGINFYYQ